MHLVSLPVRGGTGLRPVTSRWDESEEGWTPAVHGGGAGARMPRARVAGWPLLPYDTNATGVAATAAARKRVWVGQASTGAGGMPGAGPSCPSWPDTSQVILLSNRLPTASLRSTASADSSPLPPVGRDTEGVLGLAISSHTVREAGSPEFITGRETEGEGGRWRDLRAAGCHLGPPPALSPAPGLEWLRPSWRTRWVQGWLRWQQAEGKVGWEQQGAIIGC